MYIEAAPDSPRRDTPSPMPSEAGSLLEIGQRLAAQDWPLRTVEALLPDLLQRSASLAPEWRIAWMDGLHRMWHRHGWALNEDNRLSLLHLATAWCDWTLAAAVGKSLKTQGVLNTSDALAFLRAYRQLGEAKAALDLAVSFQLAHPEQTAFAAACKELLYWQRWRGQCQWVDGREYGDAEVSLDPLGHHHLPDFAWQYHDPAIAERCCLPTFESDTQWHRWLDAVYNCGDQQIYAVIHREWGFIGSVSLILHEGIGFFYYWFGPDFQGQGFGPRAVTLMLASAAERYGLHTCYAKVYEDNTPSRRALEKLGFEDIKVCAVAPDNDEVFYRRGPLADRGRIAEELHWLLAAMNSGTRPAILLQQKR